MSNCSIRSIDRNISGATNPCQNGPGSNDNEGVLLIPQSSRDVTTPSDRLESYP